MNVTQKIRTDTRYEISAAIAAAGATTTSQHPVTTKLYIPIEVTLNQIYTEIMHVLGKQLYTLNTP